MPCRLTDLPKTLSMLRVDYTGTLFGSAKPQGDTIKARWVNGGLHPLRRMHAAVAE